MGCLDRWDVMVQYGEGKEGLETTFPTVREVWNRYLVLGGVGRSGTESRPASFAGR